MSTNQPGLADIEALIEQYGLSRARGRIMDSTRSSLELRLVPARGVAGRATSRLGGRPDLPSSDAWPCLGRMALTFMGQINLAEIPRSARPDALPSTGLLSFFYDAERMADALSHGPACWRVLYFPATDGFSLVSPPKLPGQELPARDVSFVPSLTLPAPRSIELDALDLSDGEFERYWDFREAVLALYSQGAPLHRMFGHPDSIQGCMQRTVQFASRGLKLPEGVYSYHEHPRAAELIPGAHDWRLLLQVDSDEQLGVMWGDAGRVYYWIHKDDLQRLDFSRVYVFMQCY